MSETYVEQVGGSHYGGHDNQHWDLMSRYDIEYLPATASAYVLRWDLKGEPIKDLKKAISYLEKQLAVRGPCKRLVSTVEMDKFVKDNDLEHQVDKRLLLEFIHVIGDRRALQFAIYLLKEMIKREDIVKEFKHEGS